MKPIAFTERDRAYLNQREVDQDIEQLEHKLERYKFCRDLLDELPDDLGYHHILAARHSERGLLISTKAGVELCVSPSPSGKELLIHVNQYELEVCPTRLLETIQALNVGAQFIKEDGSGQ